MLLGKQKPASSHIMDGVYACLVPVKFATVTANVLQKGACNTRTCDNCHLLIMMFLPFLWSNLFREEVDEYSSHHRGARVVDQSEELIGVANIFLK